LEREKEKEKGENQDPKVEELNKELQESKEKVEALDDEK